MYERFNDHARRSVLLAEEEAKLLNHPFKGSEHLLLGIIRESEGIGAKALQTLGIGTTVPIDKLRETLVEMVGQGEQTTSGYLPYTPRAKKVLELSLREALRLNHNYIGTEHLVLGLLREGEGTACQLLVKLGIDPVILHNAVLKLVSQPPEPRTLLAGGAQNAPGNEETDPSNDAGQHFNANLLVISLSPDYREVIAKWLVNGRVDQLPPAVIIACQAILEADQAKPTNN